MLIPTPERLNGRHGIINIQNKDDRCFMNCIYRALNYDSKNSHNYIDVRDDIMSEFMKTYDFSMFFDSDNKVLPITHDNLGGYHIWANGPE